MNFKVLRSGAIFTIVTTYSALGGGSKEMTIMRMQIATSFKLLLLALGFLTGSSFAGAQTTSLDGPWSGQVVCQLNMQSPTYTRQETQTWTISGPQTPTHDQMHMYPVTWTATGSGSVQRNQNGQTFTAQWSLSPASTNGTLAIFIRNSDNRLIFRQAHSQLRADYSLRGMKQGTWNGTLQQPSAMSYSNMEWRLPWMDADPTSANPNGSFSVNAEALSAEINNPPDMLRVANCSWHFSHGSSGSTSTPANSGTMNPPSMPAGGNGNVSQNGGVNPQSPATTVSGGGCAGSANDITQTFASMKASLSQQYDRLIQEASDPTTKQSLQAQKQRTLASLDAQQQKDLQSAAGGCNGVIPQNGGSTGSGIPNTQGSNGGSPAIPKPGTTSPIMPVDSEPPTPHHKQSLTTPTSLGFIDVGRSAGAAAFFSYANDNYVYQFQFPAGAQAVVTLGGDTPGSNFALNQYNQNLMNIGTASTTNSQLNGFTIISDGNVDTILLEVVGKTGVSGGVTCNLSVAVFPGAGTATGGMQNGTGSNGGSAQNGAASGASQGAAGGGAGATTGNTQNQTGSMGSAGQSGAASGANQGAAGGGAAGGSTGNAGANPTAATHTQSLSAPINLGTVQIGSSTSYAQDFLTANDNYVFQFSFPAGGLANVTLAAQNPGTNFVLNQYKNYSISTTASLNNTLSTVMAIPSDGNLDTVLLEVRATNWSAASQRFVLTVAVSAAPVGGVTAPVKGGTILAPVQGTAVGLPPKIAKGPITGSTGNTGATGSTGATGTAPAPTAASSKYTVAISGILCARAASSSDAIYAAAYVRRYDRQTGKLSSSSGGATDPAAALAAVQAGGAPSSSGGPAFSSTQTVVYGDVNGWIGKRQQAGSRSPTGGIGIGDMIPAPPAFVPGIPNQLPLQTNMFPLSLWQGSLTDGADAVVISPSIWINYGDNPMFTTWKTNEQSMNDSLFLDSKIQGQISSQTLGPLYLGPSATGPGSIQSSATAVVNNSSEAIIASFFMIPPVMMFFEHPTHDRPVGVADGSYIGTTNVASTYTYVPNATIVLTREIIEKALGGRPWAIVAINFKDTTASFNDFPGNDRKAEYSMFIQIQRQ